MTLVLDHPDLADPDLVDDATRREFLAGAAALLVLAACGDGDGDGEAAGPSGPTTTEPTTRTIGTAFGPVQIPVRPQRVALLNVTAYDAAFSLGAPVVAALDIAVADVYQEKAAAVGGRLGQTRGPNLEALAAARPDLILDAASKGASFSAVGHDTLSAIAPHAAYDFTNDADWQGYYRFFADALNRTEQGERVLAAYTARVAGLRSRLAGRPGGVTVSVVRALPDQVQNYRQESFAASILDAAGLGAPPARGREVAFERLAELDADVMFVFVTAGTGSDTEAVMSGLAARPLWSQLNVVRTGRAHFVGRHWFGFGPTAANAVLDDLDTHVR